MAGSIELVDPSTEKVTQTVESATPAEVDRAVAAAGRAFRDWSRRTPGERAGALMALADSIEEAGGELTRLDSEDVGKPIAHARAELPGIVDVLRFTAGAARVPGPGGAGEQVAGRTSTVRREPLGVVGLVTPWNYPLLEAVWKIAPALAAGNTAVLKPSELTPRSTVLLGRLCREVLPPGAVEVVVGGAEVGRAIVEHPGIALVSLTGSIETGRAVAAAAASTLKRVHLELGGNAPVIVLDDADVEAAVESLVPAGFLNAGQDCTAASRILVADRLHDDFVEAYLAAALTLRVGDPADESTTLGPVVSHAQLGRVMGYVDRAVAAGAVVRMGGQRVDRPGWYVAPTLVTEVRQDAEIVQREVFGPVVTVQRTTSDDQALAWANDVVQGLAASVWTRDLGRAQRFTRELDFGTVWVDDHLVTAAEMPFGGFGSSGYGTELSPRSIDDYSRFKHVMTR